MRRKMKDKIFKCLMVLLFILLLYHTKVGRTLYEFLFQVNPMEKRIVYQSKFIRHFVNNERESDNNGPGQLNEKEEDCSYPHMEQQIRYTIGLSYFCFVKSFKHEPSMLIFKPKHIGSALLI